METFKGKSLSELNRLLAEKRESLRQFRFEIESGKNKNVKAGREIRGSIARILTEINAGQK